MHIKIHTFLMQMLQFLLMGIKLFTFCGFFGTVVLYPISKMGGNFANGTNPEFPGNDTTNSTFGFPVFLTPAQQTTSFLWVYLFFTYFFCFATFYFTFLNYRDYVGIRREFLLRKAKTLSARTLLITGIPPKLRSDRKLAEYFENLGIGVVESVHTIRHVSRLMEYIKERVQYLRALERSYTDYLGNPCGDPMYDPDALAAEIDANMDVSAHEGLPTHSEERERPLVRSSFLVGPKVDAIDFYSNKFEHVNDVVLKARKVGKFLPTSVGFVTFEEAISAVSEKKKKRYTFFSFFFFIKPFFFISVCGFSSLDRFYTI